MKTKINIVSTEATRRIENCKNIDDAYKHLDSLKQQLLKCHYPSNFIDEHIIEMIKFIFRNNYIRNGEDYFKMDQGVGTGNHSSGNIGDIMVDYIYKEAIDITKKEHEGLCLYMDDSRGIWDDTKDEFNKFLDVLNSIFKDKVIFIPELGEQIENKTIITFLDLKIKLDNKGKLDYEFFQKPTASGRYLHYNSHNPMKTKINIVSNESHHLPVPVSSSIDVLSHHGDLLVLFRTNSANSFLDCVALLAWF